MSDYGLSIDMVQEYSDEIKRFIRDMLKEYENEVSDGLITELSKIEDEIDVFNFIKSRGYKVKYDEFETYYNDVKKITARNGDFLEATIEEDGVTELSEEALENVSGGANFIKKGKVGLAILRSYLRISNRDMLNSISEIKEEITGDYDFERRRQYERR